MTTPYCSVCGAVPVPREHCCPTAALAEMDTLRRERDELREQVRSLGDENDVLEALRYDLRSQNELLEAQWTEVVGTLEEHGVFL
jgi:predicted nuclease with TOPRIM domain